MTKQDARNEIVHLINVGRYKATEKNDYRPVAWKDVAKECEIDTANMSKIVTGVTEPSAGTFYRIIDALGMYIKIMPKGE